MTALSLPPQVETGRASLVRITEVFLSLQGESTRSGVLTTFVRLTGCPLRCQYCDTSYAFSGGSLVTVDSVLDQVNGFGARTVCVTGGEPLAQRSVLELLVRLCDSGYSVSLETSGALDASQVDPRVSRILDMKTPGSREGHRNFMPNFEGLRPHDEVKFVICDREDYDWSVSQVRQLELDRRCAVLFSPSQQQLEAVTLADWIVADRLPVRFQLQMHKVLWGNAAGR